MTDKLYKEITKCRACNNTELVEVLDLGMQPSANAYHTQTEILPTFPLKSMRCTECYHVQLSVVVNPDYLFKNYSYVSGTSNTLDEYFREFALRVDAVLEKNDANRNKRVLDIASNDGSLLNHFKQLEYSVQGVDPAENIVRIADAKGIPTVCDYWSQELAHTLGIKYDAVVAQNVFAHVDDVDEFLQACKIVMHEKSILFIQTSQAFLFTRNEFDTMYHEHLSFFNTKSMKTVCERNGLVLNGVLHTSIHGVSYVFVITKDGFLPKNNVDSIINAENHIGLYTDATYTKFASKASEITLQLKNAIDRYRADGVYTVGFGAAAKGMTVLNYGKITLDFIIDENPLKQGLYTPGMNIPIKGLSSITALPRTPLVFVPLAWNFSDEIKTKIKTYREGIRDIFINYFPKLTISE